MRLFMAYLATHPEKLDPVKRQQWQKVARLDNQDMATVCNLAFLNVAVMKQPGTQVGAVAAGCRAVLWCCCAVPVWEASAAASCCVQLESGPMCWVVCELLHVSAAVGIGGSTPGHWDCLQVISGSWNGATAGPFCSLASLRQGG